MEQFGEHLRGLRKAANVTQSELAERLNVHLQTVSKWERNLSEPDISQLGQLAEALHVSLEKLCGQLEGEETFSGIFHAERLGKTISEQRTQRGESQEQLAAGLNTSPDAVSRWERGITAPDLHMLTALAQHFAIPVSRLYYGFSEEETIQESPAVVRRRKKIGRWAVLAVSIICMILFGGGGLVLGVYLSLSADVPQVVTYTVTLDGEPYTVADGSWFSPEPPAREGYEFIGWRDETGNVHSVIGTVSQDASYTSVFSLLEYSVEYWLNGGYFTGDAVSAITIESGSMELPFPQKDGQTFEGWYFSSDYSGDPIERISYTGTDFVLYARWSDAVYTIHYELNGGALYGSNPETVTQEKEVQLIEPVREGYLFLGWFDDPETGTRLETVGGSDARNLTLYARWQETSAYYTVYYELNGGTAEGSNPVSVGAGEVCHLYGAQKRGHTFLGWNTSADGSGDYVDTLIGIEDTLYLYAIFQPKEYTIRYEYEGTYEGTQINPNTMTYGDVVTLLPVYRYGYTFLGWYDAETGGSPVTVIDTTNIEEISTLYARFEVTEFVIVLDADGGTFSTPEGAQTSYSYILSFGETLVLPECTRAGSVFLGWFDEDGEQVTQIDTRNIRDMFLAARWRAEDQTYTVTYVLNGGTNSQENPTVVECGQVVPLCEPSREGHVFLGWYANASGTGNRYTALPAAQVEDIILYAIWQEVSTGGSWEDFEYEIHENSVTITRYTGPYGTNVDLVIPSVIEGLPVVEIKDVDKGSKTYQLRSLTIPEGVLRISSYAFQRIKIAEPVVIPSTVEVLEDHCFEYTSYPELTFAANSRLKIIDTGAFVYSGSSEQVLVLPEGVESLGDRSFASSNFYSIRLPSTLRSIAGGALTFSGYTPLYIPATVQSIASGGVFCGFGIYTSLSEDDTKNFSPDWHSGLGLGYTDEVYYDVQPVTLTLHTGTDTITMRGNEFDLLRPDKPNASFVGWQDADGNMVEQTYLVLAEDTELYAVYHEHGANDGLSADSPMLLDFGTTYEFWMPYDEVWYFVPNTQESVRIDVTATVVSRGFYTHSSYAVYVGPDGTEISSNLGTISFSPGGYFVLTPREERNVHLVTIRITKLS